MTGVAILIVVLRRAEVLVDATVAVASFNIGNAILLIAIVAATQAKWPWPLRFGSQPWRRHHHCRNLRVDSDRVRG